MNNFLFEDCRALPDQMSFVLTLPWRRLVFAVRDRDGANKNEIAISVFGVTTKDFSHDVLPTEWLYITCNEERRPAQCRLPFFGFFVGLPPIVRLMV